MKFVVSSSDLLKVCQIAYGSIGTNSFNPLMEDFLFDLKDNKLTVSATNGDTRLYLPSMSKLKKMPSLP